MALSTAAQAGLWFDLVSGVLLLVLACAILLLRPRTRLTVWLGLFCAFYGVYAVLSNIPLLREEDWGVPFLMAQAGIELLRAIALLFVVFLVPFRARRSSRLWEVIAWTAVALVSVGYTFTQVYRVIDDNVVAAWYTTVASQFRGLAERAAMAVFAVHAYRCHLADDRRGQGRFILLALALAPLLALRFGLEWASRINAPIAAEWYFWPGRAIGALFFLGVVVLWSVMAVRTAPPLRRRTAAVPLLLLAVSVLAFTVSLATGYQAGDRNPDGLNGLARTYFVLVLSYAIVRERLFDIDVKLKWTLRRGTLAGVFVAVFFVVSQLVQALAGQLFGALMGAVAAGLLLFALHPLQRLADRFADRAMPHVQDADPKYLLDKKRETYRNALAAAWSDGTLTPKDMALLSEFKAALDLPATEYSKIEREWAKASSS